MASSDRLRPGLLAQYGWTPEVAGRIAGVPAEGLLARVVRTDHGAVLVATREDFLHAAVPPGADPPPVTGDWVVVREGPGAVACVLPRTSALVRRDGGASQTLAANVDEVFVTCGLDRPLAAGQLDRALVLASDCGAAPVVVLTKADLHPCPEGVVTQVARLVPETPVVATSSIDGRGLEALRRRMTPGRTVALLGESGVGKSSLANALAGEQRQRTGEVRDRDRQGRHTTRARHLVPVGGGAVLVDTPGLRAFGIVGLRDGLARTFPDVEELAGACRFRDCTHEAEPECAVTAAVSEGTLAAGRVERYRKLAPVTRERHRRPARRRRSRR